MEGRVRSERQREWQQARTGRESHWMWQCCETNQQQHSKRITEAEAWWLGKDRLLVCVSMWSCVYSMWERLMLAVMCNYFLYVCAREGTSFLFNVSTTAIWSTVLIDLISSGCILTPHFQRNGWHHSTASEHLLNHRTWGVWAKNIKNNFINTNFSVTINKNYTNLLCKEVK